MILQLTFLTREPGAIVGPIANVLGGLYNMFFDVIYNLSPTASLGITIIIFTIFIKAIMIPLTYHQQKSMAKSQALQPELTKIQEKYKKMPNAKDPEVQQKMNIEVSELYREAGASPFSGCLPLLVQLPVLYALFYIFQRAYRYINVIGELYAKLTNIVMQADFTPVLEAFKLSHKLTDYELTNTTHVTDILYKMTSADYGAILAVAGENADAISTLLEQKYAIENFMGFSLIESPQLLSISIIIPIVSALTTFLTTYVQNKMTGTTNTNNESAMAKQMKTMNYMMPLMMGFFAFSLPAGLGLYWTIGNIFGIAQNILLKKYIMPTNTVTTAVTGKK